MSKQKATRKIERAPQGTLHIRPLVLGSVAIVIFVIIVFAALFIMGVQNRPNKVVTPDNVDELIAALDEADKTPLGAFQVSMNTEWTFPTSRKASANAYVSNKINNTHPVYFTLTMKGSEDVFYTSPSIPLGSTLRNITMDCDLKAGTYDAVLTYHLIEGDGTECSTLSVAIKIIIQK